jgi:hypothetical protein
VRARGGQIAARGLGTEAAPRLSSGGKGEGGQGLYVACRYPEEVVQRVAVVRLDVLALSGKQLAKDA